MLTLSSSNRVTFTLNVQGTAADPTVRCIIGESPSLTFPAKKLREDQYEVTIDLPSTMKEGKQPFKVEVLLNGRLFTPLNTSIDVAAGVTEAVAPVPFAKPAAVPKVPAAMDKAVKAAEKAEEPAVVEVPKKVEKKPKLFGELEKLANKKVTPKAVPPGAMPSISMKSIANEAEARETPAPAEPTPRIVIEHTKSIPISLVKGEVIYR
jgi:hypothetical protein